MGQDSPLPALIWGVLGARGGVTAKRPNGRYGPKVLAFLGGVTAVWPLRPWDAPKYDGKTGRISL